MRALQDFDEPDKLKIHANDIITIIEGRWGHILHQPGVRNHCICVRC